MITKIAASLLLVSMLAACETTKTTKRETIREMTSRYASSDANSLNEPPPPAEGPEDVPAEGPGEVLRNPGLVPTPLLRGNAAASP
ncbi:MAG: hypothetical protein M3Z64_11375 [Verrucomicrobiota bacterium]|nr:hypothetical protein [Verrucomicrobiota bacterium]